MAQPVRWKRKVDRALTYYGEVDYQKKVIRVNPAKGDLINTIIHEELHRRYPEKSEIWVRQESRKRESRLTIGEMISLLKRYQRCNFCCRRHTLRDKKRRSLVRR